MPAPETLAGIELFRRLPPEALAALDRRCAWRRVAAGQVVLGQGEADDSVYFVTAGRVRVLVHGRAGKEVIFRDVGAGGWVGEMAALDGGPRSAAIVASTAATVGVMGAAAFRAAVREHADVAGALLLSLVGQVRRLTGRVAELSTLNVRHRLYAELLRLARPSAQEHGVQVVSPPPTHAELAARVGTHREAVTKELGALRRRGLLEARRGALVLRDPHALLALADGEG